jgi:hypothetical protein
MFSKPVIVAAGRNRLLHVFRHGSDYQFLAGIGVYHVSAGKERLRPKIVINSSEGKEFADELDKLWLVVYNQRRCGNGI